MSDATLHHHRPRMGVVHSIAVGAAVLGFLFILFWAGEAGGFAPTTHRFVAIFAGDGETSGVSALTQGLPLALGIGALTGALMALFSNLFRFLER